MKISRYPFGNLALACARSRPWQGHLLLSSGMLFPPSKRRARETDARQGVLPRLDQRLASSFKCP